MVQFSDSFRIILLVCSITLFALLIRTQVHLNASKISQSNASKIFTSNASKISPSNASKIFTSNVSSARYPSLVNNSNSVSRTFIPLQDIFSSIRNGKSAMNSDSDFNFVEQANSGNVLRQAVTDLNRKTICKIRNGNLIIDDPTCKVDSLGNYLSFLYLSAAQAFQLNNTFMLHCNGNSVKRGNLLQNYFSNTIWKMTLSSEVPDLCRDCMHYFHTCRYGLSSLLPMIRKTLRRIPPPPLLLDDVILHFRCGDILNDIDMHEYGYPRYNIYEKYLFPFKSIGILTSPLSRDNARSVDAPYLETCSKLVNDIASYFIETFPGVNVTVHQNDSVQDAFSRMLYSKQVWCNPSTFCLFPALATFGHAFLLKSELYRFVEEIKGEPNIHLVNQGFLRASKIANDTMSSNDIIAWLRTTLN
jgi:hypothetical protein